MLLALVACGDGDQEPGRQKEIVTVGALEAVEGEPAMARGAQIAIAEYNASGASSFQARLRALRPENPNEGAAQTAVSLAESERLIGVVGPPSSPEARAAAPVFEERNIPYLTMATSNDGIPVAGAMNFRRLVVHDVGQGEVAGSQAAGRGGGPVAIFHDGEAGRAFADAARTGAEAAGQGVTRLDRIGDGTDLAGLGAAVTEQAPASVVYGGEAGLGLRFAQALRAAGFGGPVVVSEALALGEGLPDQMVTISPAANNEDPAVAQFSRIYRDRYSVAPPPYAVEAYEAALMLLEAAEEAGPNPRSISEFLRLNRSFLGDSKSYEFAENGELAVPVVWIYESGEGAWRFAGRSDG